MIQAGSKIVKAGLLAAVVAAASVSADDDFIFHTKSLVGIEGGYSTFDVENDIATTPPTNTYDEGMVGIKIGAQGEHFRVFLSARNYFVGKEYDYFATFGGELQYMFNFSKKANFFIGGNAGMVNGRFQAAGENFNRTFSDPYYGGDIGFNYHINDTYDFEIGARYMSTDASNTQNGVTYKIDHISTGYMSIIIKYIED